MYQRTLRWCGAVLAATLLLVLSQGQLSAQLSTITGRVVDARTGAPIQAVTVHVGDRHILTGTDGRFTLPDVPADAQLHFQRLGYEELSLPAGSLETTVRLSPLPVLMQELYVEAERGELLATGTALPVSLVDRTQLDASAGTGLAEGLDGLEGVSVSYTGAWGSRPVLRGLSGERVAVLIDGNRVSRACTYGMDQGLATVDPASVERVEVLTGPGSALYGSGNVGGVINVVTRRPQATDGLGGEVRMNGSSGIPGGSLGVSLASRVGDWVVGGSVDGASYQDYETALGAVDGSSYRHLTGDLKADWTPASGQRLSLKGQYYTGRDIGWPMRGGAEIPEESRKSISADWGWQTGGGVVDGVTARAFFQRLDHHMIMSMIMPGMNGMTMSSFTDAVSNSETSGGRVQLRLLPVNGLQVDAGVEATHLLAEGTRWTERQMGMNDPMEITFRTWPGVRVLDVGAFAQSELDLTDRLSLSGGIRLDRVDWQADVGEARDEWITTGNAGLKLAVTRNLSLRSSVGTGFRNPDPLELYGLGLRPDGFVYRGSDDLVTERSFNTEVGLSLVQGGVAASITAFRNRLDDLIVPNLTTDSVAGRPVREFENLGEARLQGVSGSLAVPVVAGLQLQGTATYTHGEDVATGDPLPLTPPLEGGVSLRRDFQGPLRWVELEWTGAARQDRVSDRAGEVETAAWAVTNLRSQVQVAGTTVTLGVENLFDELYRAHLDPMTIFRPGRNFFVKMSRAF